MKTYKINHKNRGAHNFIIYSKIDKFLKENYSLLKGKVFDLGCGEQEYKSFLLEYCDEYIGVDWGNSYHETKADLIADLNIKLPILDNTADTLFSISVLEHLKEPQLFLNETFRILKPNGIFLLQIPFQWRVHEHPFDYQRYTNFGLFSIFSKAGYVDVSLYATNGIFTTISLKINYFLLKLVRGSKFSKSIIKIFLTPIWLFNLYISSLLDNLDKNWNDETQGYWVVAKK